MVTVVIPARMASSRFPGKPLVPILGLPMVEHVRRRALKADGVDQVAVATCDVAIMEAVLAFGGNAVLTKPSHERAADRVQEAMLQLPGEIVAMVNGDEPLLVPDAITQVITPLLEYHELDVVNLLSPLETEDDYLNANIVKAVCDQYGSVIYLTRAPIPFFRHRVSVPVYRQTGIMAFRNSFLTRFSMLPETPLEKAESIDMLRVLENSIRICGVVANYQTLGVDQPSDITLIEDVLGRDPAQRELLRQTLLPVSAL